MTLPVIYTALEFYRLASGLRTYHTHYVAATTAQQAITRLHECGNIDFSECWITSDNVRERDTRAAVQTRANCNRTDEMDDNSYRRWVSVMSRGEWHDGEFSPAAWLRVPAQAEWSASSTS